MKLCTLVTALLAVSTSVLANRDDAWEYWKRQYDRVYNGPEESARRVNWEKNYENIEEHNRRYALGQETYTMGLNKFSDLTFDEFKSAYLTEMNTLKSALSSDGIPSISVTESASAPESIDWRQKGAVRRVKDQGSCGSCWAFSTVGVLEGQYYLKMNKEIEFSEQQLVDCSRDYDNYACHGGLMENAYDYIRDYGIEEELAYPYYAIERRCQYNPNKVITKVQSKQVVHNGKESDLKALIGLYGPAAVAVDVEYGFQHYKSGVYAAKDCSKRQLNHAVLAVGYGSENGQDYWIVKNSWSSAWGESGYIRMARNVNGACGIATMASIPVL